MACLRSFACVSTVLLLAACGSSSDGGAAPAPAAAVHGTIGGIPFTAADSSALQLSEATCSLGGTNASATGLVVGFGSFTGLCSFVTEHKTCGQKASATTVDVVVIHANVLGGKAGSVPTGTYTIGGASPTPDAQGNLTVAQAVVSRTDASCAEAPNLPTVTAGTVKITGVGTRTSGSVNLTLSDGGTLTGAFDVPTCTGFQTDVCTAVNGGGCSSQTCVQ
jgi:hypothetical protein